MNMQKERDDEKLLKVLAGGGVAVIPTDTLYGIVGVAQEESVVERIYKIKKRNPAKLCINLIGSLDELSKFNVTISQEQKTQIENFSEPTSFIIDSVSFRIPQNEKLRKLLLQTGPLIVPSANPEGMSPAQNIEEARKYFGDAVDLYVDGGALEGKASKIIRLHSDGSMSIVRE